MDLFISISILCGIYLAELACYQLGVRILFEVRQKSYVWMAVGIVCPVVIGMLPLDKTEKSAAVAVVVISIMFLSLEGEILETGVKLVLTLIILECIDDILVYLCRLVLKFNEGLYTDDIKYLFSKICVVIGVVFLNLMKVKLNNHVKRHINSTIYFVIGIIAVSMMFCLTALNHAKFYTNNEKFIMFCNILNVAINVSIFLLVIFVIYIKNTHEQMGRLLRTEQLLKESQVDYYKQALKKEEDTRKYRHDMMSHLAYVRDILDKNRTNDAKEYLSNILGGFQKIQSVYYVSGNEMVDVIMNHFFAMLPEDIEIVIKNKCPVEFDVEDTDICTIFSNIFQNAIEEIIEHSIEKAEIIIEVQKGKEYVEYNIKNSIASTKGKIHRNKNGFPQSRKSDKKNHGIGMINVRKAVERNHGEFQWYQEGKYFGVILILPVKRNME